MIAKTMILPAVLKYQTEIARNLSSLSATAIPNEFVKPNRTLLEGYSRKVSELHIKINILEKSLDEAQAIEDIEKQAETYCNVVLPAISDLRKVADMLEEETDDSFWPLPKYREMLFIYWFSQYKASRMMKVSLEAFFFSPIHQKNRKNTWNTRKIFKHFFVIVNKSWFIYIYFNEKNVDFFCF